jgi:pimeloyl-ACP methyl ester carboxylesterase
MYGVIYCGLLLAGTARAAVLDFSVTPEAEDNFLEAAFRCWVPDQTARPGGIVVLLPGTDGDGRPWTTDPAWRAFAAEHDLALIGAYYRGEGLSYDVPSRGSGRALDKALAYFSTTLRQPRFKTLPLFLCGHSQGAHFVYHYTAWQPARVRAFVSIKPGHYAVAPSAASFQVPGVIIAGEHDDSGRIKTVADAFLNTSGQNAKWCLLYEKDSGHGIDKSADFARSYFAGVLRADDDQGVWLEPESGRVSENPADRQVLMGWAPDHKTARLWRQIHRPARLQALRQLPPKPRLDAALNVLRPTEPLACANGQQVSGLLQVSSKTADSVVIKSIKVSGPGFSLSADGDPALPMTRRICFAPRQLPWGPKHGTLRIEGQVNGREAERLEIKLLGSVRGAVETSPSALYLGVVKAGAVVEKDIQLKSPAGQMVVRSITVPDSEQFQFRQSARDGKLTLHLQWQAGPRLGSTYHTIQIRFAAPEEGTLSVPVIGFVERR